MGEVPERVGSAHQASNCGQDLADRKFLNLQEIGPCETKDILCRFEYLGYSPSLLLLLVARKVVVVLFVKRKHPAMTITSDCYVLPYIISLIVEASLEIG